MAAIATGFLLSRMGPAWTMMAAMSAFFTGIPLIATMPIDQKYWAQAFWNASSVAGLHYTEGEMAFECRTGVQCECSPVTDHDDGGTTGRLGSGEA
ncbi:hypothetical protein B0T24DRAFT_676614 [Lasiosphaeria ovina]|uniref:Uncharacterized protein n=1 Tax=Lasiosphaeria ovina TaxID=92902 RepID=A0AAE0KFT5_9PEZI|nr:hypothetical protein B0T24DRAFT_676614 [Lasiosphaeria ovina]